MHRELGSSRWLFLALLSASFGLAPTLRAEAQTSILVGTRAEQQAEVRIRAALSTPVTLRSFDENLGVILARLSGQLHIPVHFDRNALEAINISAESQVTLQVQGVSASAALQLICERLDPTVTWTIHSEVLLVTTKEECQNKMTTRIYPVGDLLEPYVDGGGLDFEPLMDVICRVVEPASWDAEGGSGGMQPFPAGKSIVCTQSRDVHDKVGRMIEILRQVRDPSRAMSAALAAAEAAEESADENESEVDVEALLESRSRAPVVDSHPAPWRVPQRYDN